MNLLKLNLKICLFWPSSESPRISFKEQNLSSLGNLVTWYFLYFFFLLFEPGNHIVCFILKGLATASCLESVSLAHCPIGDGGLESKFRIKTCKYTFLFLSFLIGKFFSISIPVLNLSMEIVILIFILFCITQ